MKTKATPAPPAHSLIAPIEQPTRRGLEVMKGANLDKAGSPPVEHKTTHGTASVASAAADPGSSRWECRNSHSRGHASAGVGGRIRRASCGFGSTTTGIRGRNRFIE